MSTATNCSATNNTSNNSNYFNSSQHQPLNGSKQNLSLSLSNQSSSTSSSTSNNYGQAIAIGKLQDAATSPTIPIMSTLFYDCQVDSPLFYSNATDGNNDINNNNITPPSTSTSLGCSSPILNRTSPQFTNNVNNCSSNINNDTNNNIINKNTNNQRLTTSNGAIKTLVIKSNCRPSDLVCSLKSPNTCLACYNSCSTCNNNVNIKSINHDYNNNNGSCRLSSNYNSNAKRLNGSAKGLNGLNGINTSYFPAINGLGFANGYGATSLSSNNGSAGGVVRSNLILSGLPNLTTRTNDITSSTHSSGNSAHPLTSNTSNGLIGGTTVNLSPTGYDDYHLSSPGNNRNYDKFDNFNSNIFNDHCSAISAPLSQYYLDEPRHHSCFRKSIPTMPIALSAFLLLLNCFLPGSGKLYL